MRVLVVGGLGFHRSLPVAEVPSVLFGFHAFVFEGNFGWRDDFFGGIVAEIGDWPGAGCEERGREQGHHGIFHC